jgi:hypothetical protein
MSQCNKIAIDFSNRSKDGLYTSVGTYLVTDMEVSHEGDDTIFFSWLISNDVTKYAGDLFFGINFLCVVDSVVEYAWHTDSFDGISIREGVHNETDLF